MSKRSGQTIVATLIVIVIMAILAVVLLGGSRGGQSSRKDGKGTTLVGAVRYAAKDDVCRSNIRQTRQALQIAQTSTEDDSWPSSLKETRLGSDFYKCPVGGEEFTYDPATGTVKCPHPGHEKY